MAEQSFWQHCQNFTTQNFYSKSEEVMGNSLRGNVLLLYISRMSINTVNILNERTIFRGAEGDGEGEA